MRREGSGPPGPERSRPSGRDSGGKVTGIRMTVAGRPPASLQKVLPSRLFLTAGRWDGTQASTPAKTAPAAASPRTPRTIVAGRRREKRKTAAPAAKKRSAAAAANTKALARPKSNGAARSSATAQVGT